jgi:hypothetical protein
MYPLRLFSTYNGRFGKPASPPVQTQKMSLRSKPPERYLSRLQVLNNFNRPGAQAGPTAGAK